MCLVAFASPQSLFSIYGFYLVSNFDWHLVWKRKRIHIHVIRVYISQRQGSSQEKDCFQSVCFYIWASMVVEGVYMVYIHIEIIT